MTISLEICAEKSERRMEWMKDDSCGKLIVEAGEGRSGVYKAFIKAHRRNMECRG